MLHRLQGLSVVQELPTKGYNKKIMKGHPYNYTLKNKLTKTVKLLVDQVGQIGGSINTFDKLFQQLFNKMNPTSGLEKASNHTVHLYDKIQPVRLDFDDFEPGYSSPQQKHLGELVLFVDIISKYILEDELVYSYIFNESLAKRYVNFQLFYVIYSHLFCRAKFYND